MSALKLALDNVSIQCRPLLIVGLQAVNELRSQHWTKRAKFFRLYCTWLKSRLPNIFETTTGFHAKPCLWALGQHCTTKFLVQCCLRLICSTLTRQYSYAVSSLHGRQNCCQPWANIAQVISLARLPVRNCRLISCTKFFVDCKLILYR